MPRGGAHFSAVELARVLSHYDIGVIHQIEPISAGNRRAPKMVLVADKGRFLLKRRPHGKDDLQRVTLAHRVQKHLSARGFAVAGLVPRRDVPSTILPLENHIYELFEFVSGKRYDGSVEATIHVGRQLAVFHKYVAELTAPDRWPDKLVHSFHDSGVVRRYLRMIGAGKLVADKPQWKSVAKALMALYNDAAVRVNRLQFDSWPVQVVHGDWHPGNMLFRGGKIAAVLDFDSIRIAPVATDLANAMLQFSIVGGRPNPADWPDYFDQAKLLHFFQGYQKIGKLTGVQLEALVDLMTETMIAEAVLPVAATGFFGHLSGLDFLKMILRKANWLELHRKHLTEAIRNSASPAALRSN